MLILNIHIKDVFSLKENFYSVNINSKSLCMEEDISPDHRKSYFSVEGKSWFIERKTLIKNLLILKVCFGIDIPSRLFIERKILRCVWNLLLR